MSFMPRWVLNGLDLTEYPYGVRYNSVDAGEPESVRSSLASMLADGEIDVLDSDANRTYEIPVEIMASNLDEIAAAEAALIQAARVRYGTLECHPGDEMAEVSVFETFAGDMVVSTDESAEAQGMRHATLTIPARPFARAAELTVFEAPPVPPAGEVPEDVVIDDYSGDPSTRWSAIAYQGGSVVQSWSSYMFFYGTWPAGGSGGYRTMVVSRSPTIVADPSRPFIVLSGHIEWYAASTVRDLAFSGAGITTVSTSISSGTGTLAWTAVLHQTADTPGLSITAQTNSTDGGATDVRLYIDPIIQTAGADYAGIFTGKVQSRRIQILGSQRTDLSLQVSGRDADDTANAGLGARALIHTAPAGGTPFIQSRDVSGLTGPADSGALSGSYNAVYAGGTLAFNYGPRAIIPDTYAVFSRVKAATAGVYNITLAGDVSTTTTLIVNDSAAVWPAINEDTWELVPLGVATIPDIAAGNQIMIELTGPGGLLIDDLYLCLVGTNGDSGHVTLLDTSPPVGDGESISMVRLAAATVNSVVQQVWVGTADGGVLQPARPETILALDQHQGTPGALQVSTITPDCATSRVLLSYYRRYHTHVASV